MRKENFEESTHNSIIKLIHFKLGKILLETKITALLNLKSQTPGYHALGQLVARGFFTKKNKKGCFIPALSPEEADHVFFPGRI